MRTEDLIRGLPNLLSASRILLAPVVCVLLWRHSWTPALVWFLVAALTDFLDGWMARRRGWISPLGALLDPVADKVLVLSVALTLWLLALLPAWLLLLIIARDMVILGGAAFWWLRTGGLKGEPLGLGKLATLAVLALLVCTLLNQSLGGVFPEVVLPGLQWCAAVMLVVSGAAYVLKWWGKWLKVREPQ